MEDRKSQGKPCRVIFGRLSEWGQLSILNAEYWRSLSPQGSTRATVENCESTPPRAEALRKQAAELEREAQALDAQRAKSEGIYRELCDRRAKLMKIATGLECRTEYLEGKASRMTGAP